MLKLIEIGLLAVSLIVVVALVFAGPGPAPSEDPVPLGARSEPGHTRQ